MQASHNNYAKNKAWLLVALTIFFWGSNCNAIGYIANVTTPLTGAAIRFSYALILFLILRSFSTAESTLSKKDIFFLIMFGVVGVFGYNYTFFSALHSTSALNAALFMALSPAITQLLAVFMLGVRISLYQTVGIFIAFSGVLLVITRGDFSQLHYSSGDLLMLFATTLWSLFTVSVKKFSPHIPPLQLARWSVCSGSIALIVAAFLFERPLEIIPTIPLNSQLLLAYTGICGSFLAYIFWLGGIKELGAHKTALSLNMMPVVTLLINIATGSWPTLIQLLGTLIVIIGILIALNWRPKFL